MQEEARALVHRLLQEGKRYDDVRRELISQGFGTEGFEKEYPEIQKELGIEEPPPTPVVPQRPTFATPAEDVTKLSKEHSGKKIGSIVGSIVKILVALLVIGIAVILFSGYGREMRHWVVEKESQGVLYPEDLVHQARLDTLQNAAEAYRKRSLDFVGVCSDIGVNGDVYSCSENGESYAIKKELSNDKWYCVDSAGFRGILDAEPKTAFVCQ